MKRLTFFGALLLVLSVAQFGQSHAAPTPQDAPQANAIAGEFLIKFKPNSPASEKAAAVQSVGGTLGAGVPQLGVDLVTVERLKDNIAAQAAADVLTTLTNHPAVEYVEPNYIYTIADEPVRDAANILAANSVFVPMVVNITRFIPNDPSLGSQYAWDRISAFDGWHITRGSAGVVIAVVDTGVQLNHPDLAAKLVPGYDFIDNDTNPSDGNGHGTHVAGTAAAMTNNAIGGAGTCPECRIMPVRVLNNSGSGTLTGVANGIIFAANSGAQVINLSLGGSGSSTLENAVNYAWSKGSLLACAAGNDGTSDTTYAYPAAYTNCLAVGATDSADDDAWYSNWGLWVDIAAPGSAIYSTWTGSGYNTINGTSMATPHVAGVAGLVASQGLNNVQNRNRLQTTADPIDGTGLWWSNGRLNLLRAVRGS
ncbi:MAG TPA: S8 family peptidase [Herpetosiphonaceae bacterium]